MKALNAARLTPLSVLSERRTDPRKSSSLSTTSPLKLPNSATSIKTQTLNGGILLLSSVLTGGFAKALSYEEAPQQTTDTSSLLDFDPNGVFDSVVNFITENPTVAAGGAVVVAVPLILSQLFKGFKPWGVESAKSAYSKLGEDASAQLLDIRALKEFKEVGSPDVRGLGKKPVSVAFKSEDKPGFLKKLSLKFKEPETTTLYIIDKLDGNSELVAELVTANGFKAAYAVKDGVEGPRGWMKSGLPWIPPKKALDLGNLAETLGDALGEGTDAMSVALGLAAATGLGLLAFTEIETILQLLGSAAIIQLVSKKLLFAEDRKQTLKQLDEFLTTKVAPQELADDVKQIGVALPAPTEAKPEPEIEAAAEPPTQINSITATEAKADGVSGISRPLSPYASYPDLKPPTSPTPSQQIGVALSTATEAKAEPKVEAAAEPPQQINSMPATEAKADGLTGISRPLSPYASYPDLKPPISPTPSQP